jgi:A/G-specific adenine glycosylase
VVAQLSQSSLLAWYAETKRDLPWHHTNDGWKVLLSEILLQQTQVSRGIGYWLKLVERFPTPQSMAEAEVDEVLHLWQGAGYYSRARRLHSLSRQVCLPLSEGGYDGVLPTTSTQLLLLPGIGPYTAAAVASIAFGEPVACVDGNIRRVMARQTKTANPSVKEVEHWAKRNLFKADAGDWNQSLMELGATVCTPKRPKCDDCPIVLSCSGKNDALSYPQPKTTRRKRLDLMCELRYDASGLPLLVQRGENGILAGLWGPRMAEQIEVDSLRFIGEVKHILSHRDIFVQVWLGTCQQGLDPETLALSSLDRKVLALGSRQ